MTRPPRYPARSRPRSARSPAPRTCGSSRTCPKPAPGRSCAGSSRRCPTSPRSATSPRWPTPRSSTASGTRSSPPSSPRATPPANSAKPRKPKSRPSAPSRKTQRHSRAPAPEQAAVNSYALTGRKSGLALQRQAGLQQGQAPLKLGAEPAQVLGLIEPGGHRDPDDGPGERLYLEVARGLPGPDRGHRDGHIHGLPQLRKLPRSHAVEGGADRGAQGGDRPHVRRLGQEHIHPQQFHVDLQDDVFLGGEIAEERARGHLGGLGDLLHRGLVVPLLTEKPERVLPDGSTRPGLLTLPQPRPAYCVRRHAHGAILLLRGPGR